VEIEFRWSEGQSQLLPAMAADLVRRRVNLIVAAAGGAPEAAKAATATVPIVSSRAAIQWGLASSGASAGPAATSPALRLHDALKAHPTGVGEYGRSVSLDMLVEP
jgi:hypothetical protein